MRAPTTPDSPRVSQGALGERLEACVVALAGGMLAHPSNAELRRVLRVATGSPGEQGEDGIYAWAIRQAWRLVVLRLLVRREAQHSRPRRGGSRRSEWGAIGERWRTLVRAEPALARMSRRDGHGPRLFAGGRGAAEGRITGDAVRAALSALADLPSMRDADAGTRACLIDGLGWAYERMLARRLALRWREHGSANVSLAGDSGRKASGAYYTPKDLVAELIRTALEPVIAERLASVGPRARARALLGIRVCDPACGCGSFLIEAARRLALEVARVRTGRATPGVAAVRRATRDVARRCIVGVDRDALAVDVCRLSLAMEACAPGRRLINLEGRIRCGDALAGVHEAGVVALGVPAAAFAPRRGDDRAHALGLARTNRRAMESREWEATRVRIARVMGAGSRHGSAGAKAARALCDVWTTGFYQELRPGGVAITSEALAAVARGAPDSAQVVEWARACAREGRWFHWPYEFPEVLGGGVRGSRGFDVVLGNPPFLSQLSRVSAAARGLANLLAARHGRGGYADLSAVFLIDAVRMVRPGGRVALVQPRSFLATRDAAWVRERVLGEAELEALWVSDARAFAGASVFTCAPTLARMARDSGRVAASDRERVAVNVTHARDGGRTRAVVSVERRTLAESWAVLAAGDVPMVEIKPRATIGAHATATADFRDEYYGLAGFVVEDAALRGGERARAAEYPRLVTSGLIEPAESLWGRVPTRLHKRAWAAPRLDRRGLEAAGELVRWLELRLVPKVLVATQTRVMEVVVDERGEWVPTTPVVSVMPREAGRVWHVAAAVSSPVACAVAARLFGGTGLTPGAIKVSARQVLTLPAPRCGRAWDRAAAAFREASEARSATARLAALRRMGEAMIEASEVADGAAVLAWWWGRLLGRRSRAAFDEAAASG